MSIARPAGAVSPVMEPLLTYDQVAAALGISRRTLERARAAGELRAAAVGGVRFRRADVEDWIERRSRGGWETSATRQGRRTGQRAVYQVRPVPPNPRAAGRR